MCLRAAALLIQSKSSSHKASTEGNKCHLRLDDWRASCDFDIQFIADYHRNCEGQFQGSDSSGQSWSRE